MAASTSTEKVKEKAEFDSVADSAARERLVTARIGLLLKAPFFGNLATRMTLTNADEWCPTAATDGRKFYYNSKFINSLPLKQLEFLVGHEVLHAVYDHIGRRGDREPRLANIAADYCVNADLLEQRVGERITVVPILYDAKYKGMSFEEVYDDLYQNTPKMTLDQLTEMLLDEHLDGQDGEGEGEGQDGKGKDGKSGKPRLSEEERKAIRDEIKEAVLASAQASGAGNLPGGVKRLIKSLTEPVINWRELLQQQIQSTIKSDFTWQRPSRRSWHMDAILPGMKPGETVDVVVAMDTSGSISGEDIKAFLSEVKGIMESYDDYRVRVITWDTAVHNPQEFTSDNMEDILAYEPGGGGGTEPHCIWNWLKDNDIEPKKLVVFTDYCFYGFNPREVEDYCETVWVIKGNRNAQPDFGVWAVYEESKN